MRKQNKQPDWKRLCDKCEQPNLNRAWSNYCPKCRAEWYRQHEEIVRFENRSYNELLGWGNCEGRD